MQDVTYFVFSAADKVVGMYFAVDPDLVRAFQHHLPVVVVVGSCVSVCEVTLLNHHASDSCCNY